MIRSASIVAALLSSTALAIAADAPPTQFTVEQCIMILQGLSSLNFAGQQLGDSSKPGPDAKQYKLGPLRMNIAMDISALTPVYNDAQKAQQGFVAELPALPQSEAGKPPSPELQAATVAQNKAVSANWTALIAKPCPVQPGRLKASALRIGDDPDSNQFPPSVLGAIAPIVDQ